MHLDPRRFGRRKTGRTQPGAGRLGKADMTDAAGAEKAFLPRKSAVDVLIDQHEIARRVIFAQAAHRRDRDHIGAAQPLQRVDIGAVVDRGGRLDMAAPVTRQKGHRRAAQAAQQHLIRGPTPGRFDLDPARPLQPVNIIDPRAANHADHGFHLRFPLLGVFPSLGWVGPEGKSKLRQNSPQPLAVLALRQVSR